MKQKPTAEQTPEGRSRQASERGSAPSGQEQRHLARGGGTRGLSSAAFMANPFSFMRRFSEEMDRLFDDWFAEGSSRGGALGFRPQLDVSQTDGELVIATDLPGIGKDDVTIEIENDTLIIRGERRQEREGEERGLRHSERSYGSFYRAIRLPEGADTEHANAQFRNGVLEIRIPTPAARATTRRIPIRGEGQSRGGGELSSEDRPVGKTG